jgi:hypothetical protein
MRYMPDERNGGLDAERISRASKLGHTSEFPQALQLKRPPSCHHLSYCTYMSCTLLLSGRASNNFLDGKEKIIVCPNFPKPHDKRGIRHRMSNQRRAIVHKD